MSSSRSSTSSSTPASASSSSATKPAWRSAPDNFSYAKNQKFHISDSTISSERTKLKQGETLLKPVFAKESDLVKKDAKAATKNAAASSSSSASTTAAPIVISSRTMKSSAPISRAPVEVIDAGGMLKKFDEDAAVMRAPKSKQTKVVEAAEDEEMSGPSSRAQFRAASAEVEQLGATALNKWDRKAWDREQAAKQGFLPTKQAKAPLKMFLGMEAKKEVRAKRKRESDREQGLQVRSEGSITKEKRQKREAEEEGSHEASGGWKMKIGKSHSGGALSLRRSEILNVSGRGGRGGGRGGRGGRGGGRGRGR